MSTETKSEGKTRIESEISRIKMELRPSTLLVMEPKQDFSKNYWFFEYMGSSAGLPFLVKCLYLPTKLCCLYIARLLLRVTHRTKYSKEG